MDELFETIWNMSATDFTLLLVALFIGLAVVSALGSWGLYKWQKKQEDKFLKEREKRRKEFFKRR